MEGGRGKRGSVKRLIRIGLVLVGLVSMAAAGVAAARPLPSTGELTGSDPTKRGFLEAAAAVATAQAQGDPTPARGYVTGAALRALESDLQKQTVQGILVQVDLRPTAINLDQSPDPADASFTTRVHEKGFATINYLSATTHQTTRNVVDTFDTEAWMTQDQGRWMIADEHDTFVGSSARDEWLSTSGIPVIPLGVLGAILVGGSGFAVLLDRRRTRRAVVAAARVVRAATKPMPEAPVVEPARLRIRTFGGLRIVASGQDVTQELLSRPIAGFIWLYLMVRDLEDAGHRTARADLADEVFPGLLRDAQRTRLRDRLTRMRRELPQELGTRLVLEGETVGLNLEDARIDARELKRLGAIDPSERNETWLQAAQAVLGETTGGFLEGWEEVARVTEGRGASQDRVEQLAESLSSIRVDLIRVVGQSLLDLGDGAGAARCLKEGLEARPDREDVRALLVRAYAQTGQLERAEDLRREA